MVSPRKSPPPTKAAELQFGRAFDPWNSSSTGHQRAENHLGGGTGWRASRNAKLQAQFRGGAGGGARRVAYTAGAGPPDEDPRLRAVGPPALRARARTSVADMLTRPGAMRRSLSAAVTAASAPGSDGEEQADTTDTTTTTATTTTTTSGHKASRPPQREAEKELTEAGPKPSRKIFDGVVVYVNGSTHPLISDHKLKQVLADHGASMSTHLGRKKVTHVILGRPTGGRSGAGGSLSAGKLQKEIRKLGGAAVQFVGVEWVLDSIKAGRRIPEARFGPVKMAAKGQQSIYGPYAQPEGAKPPGNGRPPTGGQCLEASAVGTPNATDDEPPPSAQKFELF